MTVLESGRLDLCRALSHSFHLSVIAALHPTAPHFVLLVLRSVRGCGYGSVVAFLVNHCLLPQMRLLVLVWLRRSTCWLVVVQLLRKLTV